MIYLIPAAVLTVLNLTFAAVGPRMVPLFYIADTVVLAAALYALWQCRRQPLTFTSFALVTHFYAYNTVAKIFIREVGLQVSHRHRHPDLVAGLRDLELELSGRFEHDAGVRRIRETTNR